MAKELDENNFVLENISVGKDGTDIKKVSLNYFNLIFINYYNKINIFKVRKVTDKINYNMCEVVEYENNDYIV